MIDARWLDTSQYRIGHEARDAHAYINLFIALIQHGDFVTFSIPTLANCSCQLLLNSIIPIQFNRIYTLLYTPWIFSMRADCYKDDVSFFVNLEILIRWPTSFLDNNREKLSVKQLYKNGRIFHFLRKGANG